MEQRFVRRKQNWTGVLIDMQRDDMQRERRQAHGKVHPQPIRLLDLRAYETLISNVDNRDDRVVFAVHLEPIMEKS